VDKIEGVLADPGVAVPTLGFRGRIDIDDCGLGVDGEYDIRIGIENPSKIE
jgi:hypothetical protein